MDYNDIQVNCHGGITYGDNHLYGTEEKDMYFIGWDYNHSCSLNDMILGHSYGKLYNELNQQELIDEANKVMDAAIKAK